MSTASVAVPCAAASVSAASVSAASVAVPSAASVSAARVPSASVSAASVPPRCGVSDRDRFSYIGHTQEQPTTSDQLGHTHAIVHALFGQK